MKQSLQIKMGQSLAMTPQLQQAIKLLQLSTLELQTEIQSALESNPMLEMQEDEGSEPKDTDLANESRETAGTTYSNQRQQVVQARPAAMARQGISQSFTMPALPAFKTT